ncbi:hypothetical protein OQA88_1322 [Cercophora sp. LCS_1]
MIDRPEYTRIEKPNTRGKTLGGSSCLNCYTWIPCSAVTFNDWAEFGGDEWTWDNIEEHLYKPASYYDDGKLFPPLLSYIGQDGPIPVSHSDLLPEMAPFRDALTQAWLSKGEALTDDLHNGTTRDNRALGVEATLPSGETHTFLAKHEVIVSSGVFGVIDAPVIPEIPDCWIQNSVYMIGEKGTDMIKATYPELAESESIIADIIRDPKAYTAHAYLNLCFGDLSDPANLTWPDGYNYEASPGDTLGQSLYRSLRTDTQGFKPEHWGAVQSLSLWYIDEICPWLEGLYKDARPMLRNLEIAMSLNVYDEEAPVERNLNNSLSLFADTLESLKITLLSSTSHLERLGLGCGLSCLTRLTHLRKLDISVSLIFPSLNAMEKANICDSLPTSLETIRIDETGYCGTWYFTYTADEEEENQHQHLYWKFLAVLKRDFLVLMNESGERLPKLRAVEVIISEGNLTFREEDMHGLGPISTSKNGEIETIHCVTRQAAME